MLTLFRSIKLDLACRSPLVQLPLALVDAFDNFIIQGLGVFLAPSIEVISIDDLLKVATDAK